MTAILNYGDHAAREMSERFGGSYANAAAITALVAGDRSNGMVVVDSATQTAWGFDATSGAGAGVGVLVPDDAPASGRWLIQRAGVGTVAPAHVAAAAVLPGVGAVGVAGVPVVVYAPIVAGITGAADDVVVVESLPYACRIVNVSAVVTTIGAGGDTWTLRDAAAGAGAALSDAISVAVAGVVQWGVTALPAALAAGDDIFVRRTDDTTDGALVITLLPV